jgi:hypothetical protein
MPDTPGGQLLERRARLVTAALRAAYAWAARGREPRAFAEISRMTGVVMFELGPGRGPATPTELARCLTQPLGQLLPKLPAADDGWYGQCIDEVSLLTDDGALTAEAYEIGSDYVREVISAWDPGRDWLPGWSWMRANDVEEDLFGKLTSVGDDAAYTAARQFLVEYPAGHLEAITAECNARGTVRVARYVNIARGQSYEHGEQRVWWPCRVCGWPMDVDDKIVRCRYRFHTATYQVSDRDRGGPALLGTGQRLPAGIQAGLPVRHDADGAVQVDEPAWRFIVVPGATEIRLWRLLRNAGADLVLLYPCCDRYDLEVTVGDRVWDIDVKEHATVEGLLRRISEKPPAARHIVLPETHAGQRHALQEALPAYRVLTETQLVGQVKAAVRRRKRSAS